MSHRFFFDIANNNSDLFSYIILPVKDIEDIPLCYRYPIVRNIVGPRDLDCSNATNITKENKYSTFWNKEGKELFSEEELDPNFITNIYKDMLHVTEDEIRQLTSDHLSTIIDIRDRYSLKQINC